MSLELSNSPEVFKIVDRESPIVKSVQITSGQYLKKCQFYISSTRSVFGDVADVIQAETGLVLKISLREIEHFVVGIVDWHRHLQDLGLVLL